MPHPTPYSREFHAIRRAFPGIFDRASTEPSPAPASGTHEMADSEPNRSIADFASRSDSEIGTE
jgi:hypothetical protein